MACIKSELTLAPSEVKLFLNAVNNEPQHIDDIKSEIKKPLFKIKSALRELTETSYIEEKDGVYSILEKGKTYLKEN